MQMLAAGTLPSCDFYMANPGSCDPNDAMEKCVACKTAPKVLGGYDNLCPSQDSFPAGLQDQYMWVVSYAGGRKSGFGKVKGKYHLCLVRKATKADIEARGRQKEEVAPLSVPAAPPAHQSDMTDILMFGGVGVLILVLLGFCAFFVIQ
ncbi:MAG: hypothetical protein KVP17_000310 [Porospora cf. gigantea B]|uniref:uncharacterized protein n=1 Tax=Porospora cf. gigantea B TaxID=2853592 RepID=UPI003571F5F9|nr:MAG: hypothetical protein KVP17_000310 [Porospora cf. gigantea B]